MKKYIGLVLLTLALISCKKWQHQYPEDTERTKLTPYERIEGKWRLQSVTLNNKEYIDTISGKLGAIFVDCYDIHLSGGAREARYYISLPTANRYQAVYAFDDQQSRLIIGFQATDLNTYQDQMVIGLFRYDDSWEILKLSKDELKTKRVINDSVIINLFIKN